MLQPQMLSGSYEELFERGKMHLQLGEFEAAEAIFERLYKRLTRINETVFRRRPDLEELRVVSTSTLALLLRRRKEYDRAIDLYQKLMEITPVEDHLEWQFALAGLKVSMGDVDTGLDELRGLAMANPGEQKLWASLGLALMEIDNLPEAEVALKHAADIKSKNPEDQFAIYGALFSLYKNQARYNEAEKMWQRVVQVSTKDEAPWEPLYDMFLDAGLLERIEYWLQKDNNPFRSGLYRGKVSQARGDVDGALKIWQKTAAISPDSYKLGQDFWAEAALRSNYDPDEVARTLYQTTQDESITMLGALLLAVAEIRNRKLEQAHGLLQVYIQGLLPNPSSSSAQVKIPHKEWQLFAELLPDVEVTAEFEPYFHTETDKKMDLPAEDETSNQAQ